MPVTVRVFGQARPPLGSSADAAAPAITLDAPRFFLGRGEGCEVRIPDPSVSHRHLSVRQRGHDHVLVDEGSTNGTRIEKSVLTAHAPVAIGDRTLLRLGTVWVELTVAPDPPTAKAPKVAKEIALALVTRHLEANGEDGRPSIRVEEGASAGAEARLDPDGNVVIGRSRDATLSIEETEASRRHAEVRQRGDVLVVRDLGSKSGTFLADKQVGAVDVVWRRGEPLRIGSTILRYEYEAVDALAEIERAPDIKVPLAELELSAEAPKAEAEEEEEELGGDFEGLDDEPLEADAPADADATGGVAGTANEEEPPARELAPPERKGGRARQVAWTITDFAVVLLAMGVLSLSAVGYWVLLR